jgi:hypothetical protein
LILNEVLVIITACLVLDRMAGRCQA